MVAPPSPVSLYVTRWKAFLGALVFAGGIVVDLLFYFVWPTPTVTANPWEYQEPAKTILFIIVLLIGATFLLFCLYWTFTPRPLLRLSASGLVYCPFPLPTRTINWDDVEYVSADVARKNTSAWTHVTLLILWFAFKPYYPSVSSEQFSFHVEINPGNLSLQAGELVQLIRNYHDVEWLQEAQNAAGAEE